MTKAKRQFDRSKYLNNPNSLTDEQHARLQLAREEAGRMRPAVFWLRAAASLTVSILIAALVGWLADWSTLRTGGVIAACLIVWAAVNVLIRWYLTRRPHSP